MRWSPPILPAAAALLVLLQPGPAEARCATGWLAVWPAPGEGLPANGRVSLEGYGTDQDFVRSLRDRHPRLLSGSRSVPLDVVEIQEGAFRITQVVLVPVRPLEPGRRYVLAADGRARISVWHDGDMRRAVWTAAAEDRTPPTWGSTPGVRPGTYEELGCGPAVFGHVAVAIADAGSVRVRVRLAPAEGGAEQVYGISPAEGDLAIGHAMCSGAYELEPGARYRVTLEAVDLAGNSTPAPGAPLTIVGPSP